MSHLLSSILIYDTTQINESNDTKHILYYYPVDTAIDTIVGTAGIIHGCTVLSTQWYTTTQYMAVYGSTLYHYCIVCECNYVVVISISRNQYKHIDQLCHTLLTQCYNIFVCINNKFNTLTESNQLIDPLTRYMNLYVQYVNDVIDSTGSLIDTAIIPSLPSHYIQYYQLQHLLQRITNNQIKQYSIVNSYHQTEHQLLYSNIRDNSINETVMLLCSDSQWIDYITHSSTTSHDDDIISIDSVESNKSIQNSNSQWLSMNNGKSLPVLYINGVSHQYMLYRHHSLTVLLLLSQHIDTTHTIQLYDQLSTVLNSQLSNISHSIK